MEVDYAILAAYAELYPDGRVSLMSGGLDALTLKVAPGAPSGPFYLATRLVFSAEECGKDYQMRIELVAPDDTVVEPGEPQRIHAPPPAPGRKTKVTFVLTAAAVLSVFGDYKFRILIDEVEKKVVVFTVQPQSPTESGESP
jgi:hypothetical protein